jgi:3-deoxy-manno-octulosonate cytidylyltransferase (CMP-KDO synthetase)
MKVIAIIPARMAATRFPNKPMALINGIPMIGHCYFRSKMCEILDDVYVATCDQIIYDYIKSIGGKVIMTNNLHERATERAAEALLNIEAKVGEPNYDIIVMVQGDEPLVHPEMLIEAVQPLLGGTRMVSNLMSELSTIEEISDSNVVKVVFSKNNSALYMSREAIPSKEKYKKSFKTYRQLGLIAFTRKALFEFVNLEPTTLEIIESVDMNRFLENNIPIYMQETKYLSDAVDTLSDLERVNNKMEKDVLFQKYRLR